MSLCWVLAMHLSGCFEDDFDWMVNLKCSLESFHPKNRAYWSKSSELLFLLYQELLWNYLAVKLNHNFSFRCLYWYPVKVVSMRIGLEFSAPHPFDDARPHRPSIQRTRLSYHCFNCLTQSFHDLKSCPYYMIFLVKVLSSYIGVDVLNPYEMKPEN